MAFTQTQIRKLAGKLPECFVKTRAERGITLSYVEGWHVIDEANRVFGFDAWDRVTVSAECVWQDVRTTPKACSYAVRVRITVRAGRTVVAREGTGIGHGTGATLGEAHESAVKEAETDATKRALVTFGNLFGLALYDKERAGVQRSNADAPDAASMVWRLITDDNPPLVCETPQQFCSAAKEALRRARSADTLEALWTANASTVAQLRAVRPELRTKHGLHYADVLENLYHQQLHVLKEKAAVPLVEPQAAAQSIEGETPAGLAAPKAPEPATVIPRRVRDPVHLKSVASLPCLVCGRSPCHAHHLRFIQPRSLGSKPSDEWTVPLCPLHHRSLHDAGREEEWWRAKGIDAKAEAEKLWQSMHAPAPDLIRPTVATVASIGPQHTASTAPVEPPGPPPTDSEGQSLPVNLDADAPRLS